MSSSTRFGLLLLVCAILGGGIWQLASAQVKEEVAAVRKWEYHVVAISQDIRSAEELTGQGRGGWELVCVVQGNSETLAYFKRPK